MTQKQKELIDVRREVANTEKQLEGCIQVISYVHKMLLGGFSSQTVCIRYGNFVNQCCFFQLCSSIWPTQA
jgi:hypothetical protein